MKVVVRLDPAVAPSVSLAVLEMPMTGCNAILRIPPLAMVMVRSVDMLVALECEIDFFVALFEQGPDAQNEVFDQVYRQCASSSIRLAPPTSAFALPPQAAPPDLADIPGRLLRHMAIFASPSESERLALAPLMRRTAFKAGDVLVEEELWPRRCSS